MSGYGPLPGNPTETLSDIARVAEATAWRSRRVDVTGYIYLGARYYEPVSGRFLSSDPRGYAASLSLYDFANGDPVNHFDPDGRLAKKVADDFINGRYEAMMLHLKRLNDAVRSLAAIDSPNAVVMDVYENQFSRTKYDANRRYISPEAATPEELERSAHYYAQGDGIPLLNHESIGGGMSGDEDYTSTFGLFSHGNEGVVGINKKRITADDWSYLKSKVGAIYLFGCQVTTGEGGEYAQMIADVTGATVYASPVEVAYHNDGQVSSPELPAGTVIFQKYEPTRH